MNIHQEIFEEIKIPTVVLVENSKERFGHETVLKSLKTYFWLNYLVNESTFIDPIYSSLLISPSGCWTRNSSYLSLTSPSSIPHFSLRIFTISLRKEIRWWFKDYFLLQSKLNFVIQNFQSFMFPCDASVTFTENIKQNIEFFIR